MRNRHALDSIAFRPRVLRNVSSTDLTTTFIGTKQRMPVLLAPLASLTDVDPEGALPIARAAKEFGCLMFVSSVTRPGLDEVARAAGDNLVLQLYTDGDDRWVVDAAKRAADAGCKALVPHGRRAGVRPPRAQPARAPDDLGPPVRRAARGREPSRRADWKIVGEAAARARRAVDAQRNSNRRGHARSRSSTAST